MSRHFHGPAAPWPQALLLGSLLIASPLLASAASDPYKTPASAVGATALANGVPLSVSAKGDIKSFYTIDVPEDVGQLTVSLTGGSGDGDMWMGAAGQPASKMVYDCYTGNEGNHDTCSFYNPKPGRYTVMLSSIYIGGYTDAQLTASYTPGTQTGPKAPKLTSGTPIKVSGAAGESVLYKINVPKNTSRLTATTAGGSGDVSLSMRYQEEPSPDANQCGASCDQGFPKVGTWYVKVTGGSDFKNINLTAQLSQPAPLTSLSSGTPLTGLSGSWGEDMSYYRIDVPEGAGKLTIATSGSTSDDLLLYVSRGEVPKWWVYDCTSDVFGNGANETCVFPTPKAGTYYIGLRSFDQFSNVSLTATYELGGGGYTGGACPANTVQRTGTLYRGQAAHFKFDSAGGAKLGGKMIVQTDFIPPDVFFPQDFDLYLEQKVGDQWQVIGSATSVSTDGAVSLKSAPAGKLRWTVTAFDGSGSYRLCTTGE